MLIGALVAPLLAAQRYLNYTLGLSLVMAWEEAALYVSENTRRRR